MTMRIDTDPATKFNMKRFLHLKRALAIVWASGRVSTIASLSLLFLQGALPLLTLYLLKLLVDAVAASTGVAAKGSTFGYIALLLGLTCTVTLVGVVCRAVAALIQEAHAQTMTDHIHDTLHAKSIEIDLEYYENARYYDALHRAQQEAPSRPPLLLRSLQRVGHSGVSMVAMAGLLLTFRWWLAAVLVGAALPGLFARLRYSGHLHSWQRERTAADRRTRYFNWVLTRDIHAKEIRLFQLGPLFMRWFRDLRKELRQEKLNIARRHCMAQLVAHTSATVAVFGSCAFIVYQAVQGTIGLGDMVMYYQALNRGQASLRDMLAGLAGLYEDNLFLSDLSEFLDLKPTIVAPSSSRSIPRPIQTGIVFDHVGFQYPGSARNVLDDITLSIRAGECVAFVGKNGSGKTTLAKLLCRLYDPTEGLITIDGIDMRSFGAAAIRQELSVLFQDYAKYQLTARQNIWLGDIDVSPDDDRLLEAARNVGLDSAISGLPQGYDTILGKQFASGQDLSIGEWQKVALARALLGNRQIIILDEPTSLLDAQAECEFCGHLRQFLKGRTVILITHRLSAAVLADRIYVLEKGRVAESGRHQELLCRNGVYARLFEAQAACRALTVR